MLLNREESCLLLVDVQEKLAPHVINPDALTSRCEWLMHLAKELNVPILVSEQYPSGLGPTIKPLRDLAHQTCISKVHFSGYSEPSFLDSWQEINKKQVVIAGIETHVCVLQTAFEMYEAGFQVFVVVDAVSSRHEVDHKYGLKRMKHYGIDLVSAEMVFFEWIRKAGTPDFKSLSQRYLR